MASRRLAIERRQLRGDVIQLVVRLEEERHVEHVERRIDAAEADGGERAGLQRVETHLAQDRRLVALRAAAKDGDRHPPAGGLLPLLGHLLQVLVPDGAFGDDSGELDGANGLGVKPGFEE